MPRKAAEVTETELRILDDASSKAAARVERWIAPPLDA